MILHVTIFTQLILFLHLITFLLPNDFKSVINFTAGLFVVIMISSMEFIAFHSLKNSCKLWNPSPFTMLCVHFPNYTFQGTYNDLQWYVWYYRIVFFVPLTCIVTQQWSFICIWTQWHSPVTYKWTQKFFMIMNCSIRFPSSPLPPSPSALYDLRDFQLIFQAFMLYC